MQERGIRSSEAIRAQKRGRQISPLVRRCRRHTRALPEQDEVRTQRGVTVRVHWLWSLAAFICICLALVGGGAGRPDEEDADISPIVRQASDEQETSMR